MPSMPDTIEFNRENLFKSIIKDQFARYALFLLAIMYLMVFFAALISPYAKDYSNSHS